MRREIETGSGADALERRPQLAAALKAARKAKGARPGRQARSALQRRALKARGTKIGMAARLVPEVAIHPRMYPHFSGQVKTIPDRPRQFGTLFF